MTSRKAECWLAPDCLTLGLCGGVTSAITNCFSYVAARVERDQRTLRVSVVEGTHLVAAMAGPFLAKLIKLQLGTRSVFLGAASLTTPPSHSSHSSQRGLPRPPAPLLSGAGGAHHQQDQGEANPPASAVSPSHQASFQKYLLRLTSYPSDSIKTIFTKRENNRRGQLLMALCSLFVVQNVIVGELGILYIFLTNINMAQVFDYLSGFKNLIGALGLLVVMPIFKRFSQKRFSSLLNILYQNNQTGG